MIITQSSRLSLRSWQEKDRDLFYEINSDPKVMDFFPSLRSREQSDALMDRINAMIEQTGFGFYALENRQTGEVIGFTGVAQTDLDPYIIKDTLEVGWRLAHRYWGMGYVTEAATAALKYAFEQSGVEEIVSFAVTNNKRSIAVMRRLGMTHRPDQDFDHPRIPQTAAHLKRHVLYQLNKCDWQMNQSISNH